MVHVAAGYACGGSSRKESAYKDADDVRDVHETTALKFREDLQYFVKPLSKGFVVETLRRTYNSALVLITKMFMSTNKAIARH
mgnify:CR=1 FL=1